ncbi:hypothetical protein HDU98_008396, partial [Podochytrium sp. JEL0797]
MRPKSALSSRPGTASKNVSFNLTKNLQYDFTPVPTVSDHPCNESSDSDTDPTIPSLQLFNNPSDIDAFRRTRSGPEPESIEPTTVLRVPRPRTADLSPDLKRRLEAFRELDTFAFVKPTVSSSSSLSRGGFGGSDEGEGFRKSIQASRKMSTAARLLLARSPSDTTPPQTPPPTNPSTPRRTTPTPPRLRKQTPPAAPSSAKTFNPPSPTQVISQNNTYAIPKHPRPLSSGVRAFLVNAVVEDSVHPKLGVQKVVQMWRHENSEEVESGAEQVADSRIDVKSGRRKKKSGGGAPICRGVKVVTSLHYHLHPPRIPSSGLSLEPYEMRNGKPPTEVFRLEIPQKLRQRM